MPQLKDTPFMAWEFTDEEFPHAVIFSTLQSQHIRTEMSYFASKILETQEDPTNLNVTFGERMYAKGAVDALSALLATSINATDDLKSLMEERMRQSKGE